MSLGFIGEFPTLADEFSSAGDFCVSGSFPEKVAPTFSVREATKQELGPVMVR
ncbi:hypothetical protein [Erythrobacter sp. AP23]|uniref:hypothetical protein n=1 Tax=Erythrobacter sp. AP23 TaxID=499656 RepID=UPI0012EDD30C|nr:hypothetical protein [Erythrobacter sp. AP23]